MHLLRRTLALPHNTGTHCHTPPIALPHTAACTARNVRAHYRAYYQTLSPTGLHTAANRRAHCRTQVAARTAAHWCILPHTAAHSRTAGQLPRAPPYAVCRMPYALYAVFRIQSHMPYAVCHTPYVRRLRDRVRCCSVPPPPNPKHLAETAHKTRR
jgi:hypothetical protein